MAELILIAWRGIPAQLIARSGRQALRHELPPRFAAAIDRAAMRGGARDEAAYLEGWTRTTIGSVADAGELAARAALIEAEYDEDRLEALVRSGGVA
jgi:hypothetical protein